MLLATSENIREIDNYAEQTLGIPSRELIARSGNAVASVVRERVKLGSRVLILAGKGNNGADGYAAAIALMKDYDVLVFDVLGEGQRSDGGKLCLEEFISLGGIIRKLESDEAFYAELKGCDCVIDAIFGTGFKGKVQGRLKILSEMIRSHDSLEKIAVDVPLGVNADNGSVDVDVAYRATSTVSLSFVKPGLVSYPAKDYVGKLINDNIGLHIPQILSNIHLNYHLIDKELALSFLPEREGNSNKGSFGKALVITGSRAYPGAAHLSLEAALRGGVGLVTYVGESDILKTLLPVLPEAIYRERSDFDTLTDTDISELVKLSERHSVTLVGSGCGRTDGLYRLVRALLSSSGGALILDADAINVLSDNRDEGLSLLSASRRHVILTPHPLEIARLMDSSVDEVQSNRLSVARSFAEKYNCILVLKGAATVLTDGKEVFINSSGSSALAKGGSGDVLAGFLASMCAWCDDPLRASAFSVYVHGAAADQLAKELSEIGVTPSDLPKQMARFVAD